MTAMRSGSSPPVKVRSSPRSATIPSNTLFTSRSATTFWLCMPNVRGWPSGPRSESRRRSTRFGSGTGSGRKKDVFTRLKIAVLPPIPKASVSTTIAVNAGALVSSRNEYRRSCQIDCMKGTSVDLARPGRRHRRGLGSACLDGNRPFPFRFSSDMDEERSSVFPDNTARNNGRHRCALEFSSIKWRVPGLA